MPGDPRFLAATDEIRRMHIKKAADYGTATDPFANIRASEEFGIPGYLSSVLRANDKMARLKAFAVNGKLENESVEDSLLDMANYALIALVLWREKRAASIHERIAETVTSLPEPQLASSILVQEGDSTPVNSEPAFLATKAEWARKPLAGMGKV